MGRCQNPRRYPRLDTELPVRVLSIQTEHLLSAQDHDLPYPPMRFFDRDKEAWLDQKVIKYRKSIDSVVARYGEQVKPPFNMLSEKLVFIEDMLHYLADARNPLKQAEAQKTQQRFQQYLTPIDVSVLGKSKTAEILAALDEKAIFFIRVLQEIFKTSDKFHFHVEYVPNTFAIDAHIKTLSQTQGILAMAFTNLYDYLQELVAIHEHINDIMDYERLKKLGQKVNLSAGGIRLHVPHRLKQYEKVHVDLIVHVKPCPVTRGIIRNSTLNIRREENNFFLRVEGSIVREVFDSQLGQWEAAINFEMLDSNEFHLISAFIAQKDYDAILGARNKTEASSD